MAEKLSSSELKRTQYKAWRKQHRFSIQSAALVVAILTPFAIYWSLEAGQDYLAAFFFGLLALALFIAAWIG
jgi:hypothetical protein